MPKLTRREFAAGSAVAFQPLRLSGAQAEKPSVRRLLARTVTPLKLTTALLPRAKWKPFPPAAERAAWEALPESKALVAAGEERLGAEWTPLAATLFLDYARNGNRSRYERVRSGRRERLAALVLAECAEAKGRFLDEIGNGIWSTCEETFWGVPAHISAQKKGKGLADASEPIVDLFAAETAALLAWTDYLLGEALDKVSPRLRERIRWEVNRRLLRPCMERVDFWWMGLDPKLTREVNNWNPWINSNWLTSALLLEDERRRWAHVYKILRSLDRFLDAYHDDGGCDEGPGYWFRAGGSLYDCLELVRSATAGKLNFFGLPLVREIGRYICRAHIYDDYVINFADASAKVRLEGELIFRYGERVRDLDMQGLGAWAAAREGREPGRGSSLGRMLPKLFDGAVRAAPRSQALLRDTWLPGIQVMAARCREGSPEGFYLAAQGGHNAESHNHNDVGNFIVYADGKPAIIDVGVETYSARTFSAQRYEIWTMQSAYHNLPTIGGVMQGAGREFAAREVGYSADDHKAELTLDIARAYPAEAGVRSWKRRLRLDRAKNEVEVADLYALSTAAPKITLTLMTPWRPETGAAGELVLPNEGRATVVTHEKTLTPVVEEIKIEDERLNGVWGPRLYRVLLTADKPPREGAWTTRFTQK